MMACMRDEGGYHRSGGVLSLRDIELDGHIINDENDLLSNRLQTIKEASVYPDIRVALGEDHQPWRFGNDARR
jgi:hypothetical protein